MIRVPAMLKRVAPAGVRRFLRRVERHVWHEYGKRSYSHEGEDILLDKLFTGCAKGFYVDVGAHHPVRFSNTYLFYRRGWRGINIDAMPGSMRAFERKRPRDINVEAAVSDTVDNLVYYAFDQPAFNGLSTELSRQRVAEGVEMMWTKTLRTRTLCDVLEGSLPEGQEIDFVTVDVEGYDLKVLRSMDWQRYHPKAVVVELSQTTIDGVLAHPIHCYLTELGYQLYSKLDDSCIYVSSQVLIAKTHEMVATQSLERTKK
jgi:FkbM family methyltransferase